MLAPILHMHGCRTGARRNLLAAWTFRPACLVVVGVHVRMRRLQPVGGSLVEFHSASMQRQVAVVQILGPVMVVLSLWEEPQHAGQWR